MSSNVCECVCVGWWGVGGGVPSLPWTPVCVGSSPDMTGLSLLTQGDWAEGTAAHNGG